MSKSSVIDFLQRGRKGPISSNLLKAGSVLNLKDGEQAVLTYTSATDKMRAFTAFIRDGLESGGAAFYVYPDEESETIRTKLREHGINVEKYEKDGALQLKSLTEYFKSNGKLDYEKAVTDGLNWWAWAKRKRHRSIRDIEDVGDFSFFNGQWQKYITDYWLNPGWEDPAVSEWVVTKGTVGAVYIPLLKAITAINVERMTETQVAELLKAFGRGTMTLKRFFIDLLESVDLFSGSIDLDHGRLVGRKILLEYDPSSDYENIVDDLMKESMANVEPIFVFAPSKGVIHMHLAKQPAIKFFLMSMLTSTPNPASENEVLLPAKNAPQILDAIDKLLDTYSDVNICFVFDLPSELLTAMKLEKTFTFLRNALEMLSSERITCLFLLNTSAHEPEVVSRIRELFHNLLTCDEYGLKIVKIS